MRRVMMAGVALLGLCGQALAADLGIKLDDFDAVFNSSAEPLHADLRLSRPVCASRDFCTLEAGAEVTILLTATPDGETVISAQATTDGETRASGARFAEACDGLVALLSPALDARKRGQKLSALVDDVVSGGRPASFVIGSMSYELYHLPTGVLAFTASRS